MCVCVCDNFIVARTLSFLLNFAAFCRQWRTDPVHANPISVTWTVEKYKNGFVAWAAAAFIVLTSLPFVRRNFFNTFMYSHFAFVLFFLFGYFHTPAFAKYFFAAVIIYGIDKLLRAVWGTLPTKTLFIDTSHEGIVSLTFPKNAVVRAMGNYRPGQYVSEVVCFFFCFCVFVCVCVCVCLCILAMCWIVVKYRSHELTSWIAQPFLHPTRRCL